MVELVFEILGAFNVLAAIYYWIMDRNDIINWLFFLLMSAIMYINASRYDKGN